MKLLIANGHLIDPAENQNSGKNLLALAYLDQVKYGVAVCMAVLYLATGGRLIGD